MLNVATDVRLEQNRFILSADAATIDEVLHHVSDFRDVGVRWNITSVRQNKTRESFWMLLKRLSKVKEFHAGIYIPI